MIEDAVDRMKTEAGDIILIAVGGGAFLVPDRLAGISEVIRVPHGDCANAVGAATAQISGETDQVYRDLSRADAIAAAEAQHAARHLLECLSLAPSIQDFGAFETHETFASRLHAKHGRKVGFWGQVAELSETRR